MAGARSYSGTLGTPPESARNDPARIRRAVRRGWTPTERTSRLHLRVEPPTVQEKGGRSVVTQWQQPGLAVLDRPVTTTAGLPHTPPFHLLTRYPDQGQRSHMRRHTTRVALPYLSVVRPARWHAEACGL